MVLIQPKLHEVTAVLKPYPDDIRNHWYRREDARYYLEIVVIHSDIGRKFAQKVNSDVRKIRRVYGGMQESHIIIDNVFGVDGYTIDQVMGKRLIYLVAGYSLYNFNINELHVKPKSLINVFDVVQCLDYKQRYMADLYADIDDDSLSHIPVY